MYTEPLFLDAPLQFEGAEKLAGMLTRLGDNVDNWHQEIMQEAYKQLPYLSQYDAHVILDKVDEERGYAFGSIEVRPKTAMTVEEMQTSGMDKVHIPLIVKEQMLSPLDVFLSGKKYFHLTEGKLREMLIRPEAFDVARLRPYDPSLVHDLQPPLRSGFGGFGAGGVKVGSAEAELEGLPLLPQLYGRIRESHADRMKTAMADPSLRAAVRNGDDGVKAAFASALRLNPSDPEKVASLVASRIKPTVVQLTKLGTDKVMVKWATDEMFAPQQEQVPMAVAQDLMGDQDMQQQLEADGTVTMSPDAPVKQTLEAEEVKVADSFGIWKVQDANGNTLLGWVFPKLMTLDLQVLPLSLFNNGSQHALQEAVAGEIAGKSTDIPKGIPRGYGALYYLDHGTAKAFIPMTVTSSMQGPQGVRFLAQTDLGDQLTFSFAEGLSKPARVAETEWVLPNFLNWMPLRGKTELVSEPSMFSKLAAAKAEFSYEDALRAVIMSDLKEGKVVGASKRQQAKEYKDLRKSPQSLHVDPKGPVAMKKTGGVLGTVDIVGDKAGIFTFRGPAIAKVAEDHTKFIDHNKAMFLGVALGMNPGFCKTALARAQSGELVSVAGLKVLGSVKEKMAGIKAKIIKELSELDPTIHNYFLAKEASVLDDALTADKILGLGFLNAENVSTFIDLLPALQAASGKLAELLVAVRIGLKEVPEVAVERMLFALEDVIRGLQSLRQKELRFSN